MMNEQSLIDHMLVFTDTSPRTDSSQATTASSDTSFPTPCTFLVTPAVVSDTDSLPLLVQVLRCIQDLSQSYTVYRQAAQADEVPH